MSWKVRALLASAVIVSGITGANASVYNSVYAVTASESATNGNGFDTANGNPFTCGSANTACASFTYTGPIAFSNNAPQSGVSHQGDTNRDFGFTATSITSYSGSGTVDVNGTRVANFANKGTFLNASGSASGFAYGTYFTFDLGQVVAGTVLTITHDDGASLFQNGVQVGPTVSGQTSQTTDVVRFDKTGSTILRYARENGTPSILIQSVPEPVSIALLGTGLIGIGLSRSARRLKNAA